MLVAPFVPARKRIGRPRTTNLRDVLDAILHMASTSCQWAMLPHDFPPPSMVQRYFYARRDGGLLEANNHHLVMAARELSGREASPRAGPTLQAALAKIGHWTIEIVKRSYSMKGSEILPRRWILIAHIHLVTRRIARYCYVD